MSLYLSSALKFWLFSLFLVTFLIPVFQSGIANITLGNEPTGLRMAIVNDEINPVLSRVCTNLTGCEYSMLSCRYLRYISDNIIQVYNFLTFGYIIQWYFSIAIFCERAGSLWKCLGRSRGWKKGSRLGCHPVWSKFYRRVWNEGMGSRIRQHHRKAN